MTNANVNHSQLGVIGHGTHIEGGIHFQGLPSHPLPPPWQLPPRVEQFVGREKELQWLDQALHPGQVVTLCGLGGVGKTALAAEALHRLPPDRFPDGIVFYSFYGKPDADKALEAIALAYGEEPGASSAVAAQRVLSGRKALLVLDGAEKADNLVAVLDVRGGCGVLITSQALSDAQAKRKDVEPLPQDDAVTLLRKWGGEYATDEGAARQVCTLVGRLPLAVRLVGRYLRESKSSVKEYLAWLEETPLEALDQGERQQESVPTLLKRSLKQVSQTAHDVLAVAVCLALAPFGQEPIAAALNLSPSALRKSLGELINYGLLWRDGEDYGVSHALVHTYVRERIGVPDETVERLAGYYIELTEAEVKKGLEGYNRLDARRPHLMSVLDRCTDGEWWQVVRDLVWAMDEYLEKQGHWTERVKALKASEKAAQKLGNRQDEATFLGMLGRTYRALGKAQDAIGFYDHALSIARGISNRKEEGRWLGHKGSAYRTLGKYEEAIRLYEKALDIAREVGDREREGVHLGRLGLCYQLQGKPEEAIGEHEKALEIARETVGHQQESVQLGFLGRAHRALGQIDKAYECHTDALCIAQAEGHRQEESVQLGCLGLVDRAQGRMKQACEYHKKALRIAREIGNRWEEEYNLGHLGHVYYVLGKYDEAITHYEDSLKQAIELNDLRGEGIRLSSLGTAYHVLGWTEEATECQQEAKFIFDAVDERLGQSYCLLKLGRIRLVAGKPDEAQDLCQVARDLDRLETSYQAALMLGIVVLHQKGPTAGKEQDFSDTEEMFVDSVGKCRDLLGRTNNLYQARYTLATALVGQAVCNPGWAQEDERTRLLAPALDEYHQALENCSERGVISDVLGDLELIQKTGVEGLEPVLDLLKNEISLEQHRQTVEELQQTRDAACEIAGQHCEAFRRWRLGLRYLESDPAMAEKLMSEYVEYLRENNSPDSGPGLAAATEDVTYVHEIIAPDLDPATERVAYLREIGHPDPESGAKGVALRKARNHLEHALASLEEAQSPNVEQTRKLLASVTDELTLRNHVVWGAGERWVK